MNPYLELPAFDPAAARTDRVALITEDGTISEAELARRASLHIARWQQHGTGIVGLRAGSRPDPIAAAVAAALTGTPLVLLAPEPAADVLAALATVAAPDEVLGDDGVESRPRSASRLEPGTVVIVTSGTGGAPKIVRHDWASLARPVRTRPELAGSVWLLTYPWHLYAGLQVVLHAWLNRGTLVMLPTSREPDEIVSLAERAGVTHVSATPSFFRRLLLLPDRPRLGRLGFRQVTLGGERATQPVLDDLRATFPRARIVHIYATTELGRCFAIEDGREGFPAAMLAAPTADGVGLRVQNGELEVRPVHGMRGYLSASRPASADGWIATGDLVEIRGDRVVFLGRRSDVINVGGNKVNPQRVEEVLRGCAHVRDVRVYGKASALVGQLVAADVVVEGIDEAQARARIQELANAQLTEPERPRFLKFVDRVALSAAGKMVRRSEGES